MGLDSSDRPRYGSVLIIDDDPSVSILLRESLKKAGFDVEQAYTGAEAKAMLDRRRFNFVVLDIYIGKDNGEDIIQSIRFRSCMNQKTPILVMSSKPSAELIQRISAHVSTIMVKPLNFEKIVAMLRKMVFSPRLCAGPATVMIRATPTRKAA